MKKLKFVFITCSLGMVIYFNQEYFLDMTKTLVDEKKDDLNETLKKKNLHNAFGKILESKRQPATEASAPWNSASSIHSNLESSINTFQQNMENEAISEEEFDIEQMSVSELEEVIALQLQKISSDQSRLNSIEEMSFEGKKVTSEAEMAAIKKQIEQKKQKLDTYISKLNDIKYETSD